MSQYTIAVSTLNFSIVAFVALNGHTFGPSDGDTQTLMVVCAVVNVGWAVAWFLLPLYRVPQVCLAFAIWADVGTASVLLTFSSRSDALVGCSLFVITGMFYIFFLTRRWIVVHLIFCALVIATVTALAFVDREVPWPTLIARLDVVAASVLGLPIAIHVAWRRALRGARRARRDPLTGLLNRSGLESGIRRICRENAERRISLLLAVADVDNFKSVNDRFGHDVGDATLKGVASSLRSQFPRDSLIARSGGEEFVIVMAATEAQIGDVLEAMSTRVCISVSAAFECTISVGVEVLDSACVKPVDIERAIACADSAMYEAKRAGGDAVGYYRRDSARAKR